MTSAHSTSEQTPRTLGTSGGSPARVKQTLSAYSGLVPMSPNTTPIAAMTDTAYAADVGNLIDEER